MNELQSQVERTVQEKKEELINSAQDEVKKVLITQIQSFFTDPELASELGITEEKKEELLQKLEETVQEYDMEASDIEGFQEQINEILEKELQNQHTEESSAETEQEKEDDTAAQLKEQLRTACKQFLGRDGE